ncbi:MAG: hypothetical protein HOE92_00105 [Euryarchaeota archaeon]|jgi:hypothetical protein|nr:hypothetical protein [Euryarchaeota archaeon]MBT3970603.1 hypothetical protein [Euryarchaeota archaeon]MBT4408116.1 hypothetical protein [Euryarchaeota archaeon]MBT6645020.1 hypothetical protein [Euryarchaeota archaeon]
MTGEGMTSVSVSYETRRHINTLRSLEGIKSVDACIMSLVKEHKMAKMRGVTDDLRAKIEELQGIDADLLIQRLGLCPFPV